VPAERVAPPLVAECFANLECKVVDTRLVNRYNLFVLEVLKAWTDPAQKDPKTIHHRGHGRFAVDGEMIKLRPFPPLDRKLSDRIPHPKPTSRREVHPFRMCYLHLLLQHRHYLGGLTALARCGRIAVCIG
jgi:Flavin reductase like domain